MSAQDIHPRMMERLISVAREFNRKGVAIGYPLSGQPIRLPCDGRTLFRLPVTGKAIPSFAIDGSIPIQHPDSDTRKFLVRPGVHASGETVFFYVEIT